jgi:predicted metal-dependent peptidase
MARYDDKIQVGLLKLLWKEPFFSGVIRGISKREDNTIPTAGVMVQNGEYQLLYNNEFVDSLSDKEIIGLLKHECYHLILNHVTTRKKEPFLAWNWAADLAINSHIPEDELPECGLIPGKRPVIPEDMKLDEDMKKRQDAIGDLLESLPKYQSSEWYFEKLMQNEDFKEMTEGGEGYGIPGMDDHDGWGDMSDEQKELMKEKIKQAIKDAAKQCDEKGQWGSVSGEMRENIRKMISNDIPWNSILKQFCGMTRRANRISSMKRVNKKYPGIHSGYQKSYEASIAVYIDQSGSVSDKELSLFSAELEQLSKRVEFTLYNFDTDVDNNSERTFKKGSNIQLERTRCGGTSFSCIGQHLKNTKKKFDACIILTDGYAPEPQRFLVRRAWVITSNGVSPVSNPKETVCKMRS